MMTDQGMTRASVAVELLRGREITRVLDALHARGIDPILLKGTPLAYSIYDSPALRPREDTDMLIRAEDGDAVRRIMTLLGYSAPAYCDDVHYQFPLERYDEYGAAHAFDFHWRLSTQAAFADLLTFEEMDTEARAVPALGPIARAAKGVAAICAQQLARAQKRFGTEVPAAVMARLGAARGESTAAYLEPGRTWRDELVSNVRALGFGDRLRLLRRVAFPDPAYMLRTYGLRAGTVDATLLPALYVLRGLKGLWKVATGRK
jgi:hypothetical protein